MIKKYNLEKYGTTEILESIREVLSVQMQGDSLVIWVDSSGYSEERNWTFHSVFTGDNSIPHAAYIGTVQDKSLVYHVYAS
jgi:hypothetical protein